LVSLIEVKLELKKKKHLSTLSENFKNIILFTKY